MKSPSEARRFLLLIALAPLRLQGDAIHCIASRFRPRLPPHHRRSSDNTPCHGPPERPVPRPKTMKGRAFSHPPGLFGFMQKCVIAEHRAFAKMRLDAVSTPAAQGDRTCSRPPASSKRRTTPAPPPALVPPPSCPVSTGSTGVLKPSADPHSPPPHELRCSRLPCHETRWPTATAGHKRPSTSSASGPSQSRSPAS